MEFCDLQAQRTRISERIDQAIKKVLNHGKFILGPEVQELELKLGEFTGAKHCITCANGTDALQIALRALNIGKGDEVILPAFSFFATVEVVLLLDATPVFVDVCPATFNIDPNLIEAQVTKQTKAIIAVSLFGQCADFTAINRIADKYDLAVIEDAAQSFGATHAERSSCALTTIGCTSFFPAKPLGCYGDGGAMFTNDEIVADRLRSLARHGQSQRYVHEEAGLNSRLDTLQAAILLEKLAIYRDEIKLRNQAAERYNQGLAASQLVLPKVMPENKSVFAQYTVQCQHRNTLKNSLLTAGIPTAIHYPRPLHLQPAVTGYNASILSVAEHLAGHVLSLPMHPYLKPEEQENIIETILAVDNSS